MMFRRRRHVKSIQRVIANRAFYSRIMTLWAFVTVVLVGYFSFMLLVRVFPCKRRLLGRLPDVNSQLSKNSTTLTVLSYNMEKLSDSLDHVMRYIPSNYGGDTFLYELSYVATRSGFSLDRYSPSEEDGVFIVNVRLLKDGDLSKFLELLEKLPRISSVRTISYSRKGSRQVVILKLRLYKISEEDLR